MIGDNGCGLGLVNSPKINVLAHIDPRSPWRGRQQSISSLFLIIDLHILHVAMVYSSLILRVCCINSRAMCSLFSRCSAPHDHFHTWFYFPTALMPSVWLSCWLLWRARSPPGEMMSRFVGHPSDLSVSRTRTRWWSAAGGAGSLREFVWQQHDLQPENGMPLGWQGIIIHEILIRKMCFLCSAKCTKAIVESWIALFKDGLCEENVTSFLLKLEIKEQ